METVQAPEIAAQPNLKGRLDSLRRSLRQHSRSYDRMFAWVEAGLTAAGAICLAVGGGYIAINKAVGISLFLSGGLATLAAVLLALGRKTGPMETITDAVAAVHEAEASRLQTVQACRAAEYERDEHKRSAELAIAEAKVAVAEAERRLAEFEAQARGAADEKERIATRIDGQRRARLRAMRGLVETIEAALLLHKDVAETAERMLQSVNQHIRAAVGVELNDYFTVSIFRSEDRGEGERMYRIGCYSTHLRERDYDTVSWKKGRGYTGTVWHEATANVMAELVIPDTTLPEIKAHCPVDDPDPEREARYLSIAAYPIRIRRSQQVWGVVTSTIERKHVFARVGPQAIPTQGVEMTEDIAYVAALLAGLGNARNG